MYSSAGFSSPRGPFAGAAPLAHRPLSAIAATTAGGVPQKRIQRIIAELIPVLEDLHQHGRLCGDISVHSVGMDEDGKAHLMALAAAARTPDAPPLTPGYAPFELYTEASEWPRGPWTDIYALSAVAHSLVTGRRPPAAPERRVNDTYRPLAAQELPNYDAGFLAAIDAGLAMRPASRPQALRDYAELLALPATPRAAQPVSEPAEPAEPSYQTDDVYASRRGLQLRSICKAALLGLATIAVAVYWWTRLTEKPNKVITHSEPAVVRSGALSPSLEAPSPVVPPPVNSLPAPTDSPVSAGPVADGVTDTAAPGVASASAEPEAQAPAAADDTKPVTADQPAAPAATPVRVSINVRPWGEILINGVSRGVTPPLKTLRLAPGRYKVTIRNSAQPAYRTTLEVKPGKPTVITHVFR